MRKFLFAIAAPCMISVMAMACTKEEHAENNPEQVYQEMLEQYSATVPDEGVEESFTIIEAQLDELAMAQSFWPREVLAMVLPVEGNRSRPATYQERLEVLRSYWPERSEDPSTVQTWIRRQNAPALRDATGLQPDTVVFGLKDPFTRLTALQRLPQTDWYHRRVRC